MKYPQDFSYARLTLVDTDSYHGYYLSASIMENRLRLSRGDDICEYIYMFDEQTTAKFESRFQSLGNSELFLWKLRETYARKGDNAEKTLNRILAYCDRKGMSYEKSMDVSFDDRE